MAVPFLPPTKLQLRILDHFVEEQGYGSGVHKLYRRLKVLFDGLIHPAMDDEGDVAYTKGGDVWEEVNTPKNVKDHSYILDGKKYTYETREVVRKGKKKIERRKYLPTQLAIQDYLSENATHQKNRMPKQRPAAGVRNPPKHSISPIIPKHARPLDIVAADSFRMPKTMHKGKEYSWAVVFICGVTKVVYLEHVYLNTALSTGSKEQRPQSSQTWAAFKRFVDTVNRTINHAEFYHPRLLIQDNGSEWKSTFKNGMERRRGEHKGYYQQYITPASRSRSNAFAERAVQTCRRRLFAIQQAYMKQAEEEMDRLGRDPKIVKIPNWHTNRQTPGLYNWILDLKEVQFRINTAWHRTIKATPLDALLKQNGSSWKKALDNIKEYAEKAYRGVKHNAPLVGHTPAEEEAKGDYVRLRLFKAGDKNVKFTGKSTKSARDNFSEDIYRIMRVVTKENKARIFYIENIDPNGKQAPKAGLDRTQILKIHKHTKLSNGRTVEEEDAFLNKDDEEEEDDEDEEKEATIPRPSRSNEQKEVDKLLKMTLKQWAKFLRKKEFDYDETPPIRTRITNLRSQGRKFKDWVVETKDISDGDLGEIEFELMLDLAQKENWFTNAIRLFTKKAFL